MSEFECNHGNLVGSTGGCGLPGCHVVKMDGLNRQQCNMQRDYERTHPEEFRQCEEEGDEDVDE